MIKQKEIVDNELKGPFVGDAGFIAIVVQEKLSAKFNINLNFKVKSLPVMRNFWECNLASTFFMELWKGEENNEVKIYESDLWVNEFEKEFKLKFTDAELCNCKPSLPIQIKFISRNQYRMENKIAASVNTTLHKLTESQIKKESVQLVKPNGIEFGKIEVQSIEMTKIATFAQYIADGTQIALIGAIDFTYSNGATCNPSSLHYVSPGKQNQYETALEAVGEVLAPYDADQMYPFYGFGAVPPGQTEVSHCFQIDPDNEEVQGIQNVLKAYRKCA